MATFAYYAGSGTSTLIGSTAPTNVGTYTVVAWFAGTTDYTAASATTTFTISTIVPIQIGNGAAGSYAQPGAAVPLEVDLINYASPVNGIHLAVDYDPSVLTINLTDISTTGLSTQSWGGAWNIITRDAHDAEVLGSLSSVSAFGTSSASVVQLTFHVNSGVSPGPSAVSVDPGTDNYGTYLYVGATQQAWSAINTQINVQVTPTITWATPTAITYGTALSYAVGCNVGGGGVADVQSGGECGAERGHRSRR